MPELQVELEIKRLTNLVEAFGWKKSRVETGETEVVVTFIKKITEPIPAEAVGAD